MRNFWGYLGGIVLVQLISGCLSFAASPQEVIRADQEKAKQLTEQLKKDSENELYPVFQNDVTEKASGVNGAPSSPKKIEGLQFLHMKSITDTQLAELAYQNNVFRAKTIGDELKDLMSQLGIKPPKTLAKQIGKYALIGAGLTFVPIGTTALAGYGAYIGGKAAVQAIGEANEEYKVRYDTAEKEKLLKNKTDKKYLKQRFEQRKKEFEKLSKKCDASRELLAKIDNNRKIIESDLNLELKTAVNLGNSLDAEVKRAQTYVLEKPKDPTPELKTQTELSKDELEGPFRVLDAMNKKSADERAKEASGKVKPATSAGRLPPTELGDKATDSDTAK